MSQEGSGRHNQLCWVDLKKVDSFQIEKISWPREDYSKDQWGPMKKSKQKRKKLSPPTIKNKVMGGGRVVYSQEQKQLPTFKKCSSDQMIQSLSGPPQPECIRLKRAFDERDG